MPDPDRQSNAEPVSVILGLIIFVGTLGLLTLGLWGLLELLMVAAKT